MTRGQDIAEMKKELAKPRAAASTFTLVGVDAVAAFRRPVRQKAAPRPKSLKLERSHTANEFEAHICANRGW
jgi:hypothetical protein